MLYNHNPNAFDIHEEYRQDRLREAEQHRLIQIAKQRDKSESFARKRVAELGNLLVTLGQSLQAPSTEPSPINTISRPVS